MQKKNKEYGSDFHYLGDQRFRTAADRPNLFAECTHLYYSGRAALFAIVENGIRQFSWKKIYVPSYYCQEVYEYIRALDIVIEYYDYNPFLETGDYLFDDDPHHVLLVVNYFGIRTLDHTPYRNMVIIEDLTHNLERVAGSGADYVFGSLRKVLPVPVGGFVKSREPGILPEPAYAVKAEEIALRKWTAMYLKKDYLETGGDTKPLFRSLFASGEAIFAEPWKNAAMPDIVRAYLISLDVEKIIAEKKRNAAAITAAIRPNDVFQVISSADFSEFACILKFNDMGGRNDLRNYLVKNDIYPIVLWPGQHNEQDRMMADRILFIHIDFRYNDKDMEYLAGAVNNFLA